MLHLIKKSTHTPMTQQLCLCVVSVTCHCIQIAWKLRGLKKYSLSQKREKPEKLLGSSHVQPGVRTLDWKSLWKQEDGSIMVFFHLFCSQVARLREGRFRGRLLCASHQGAASNLSDPRGVWLYQLQCWYQGCHFLEQEWGSNEYLLITPSPPGGVHSATPYYPVEHSHGVCYPHFIEEETEA